MPKAWAIGGAKLSGMAFLAAVRTTEEQWPLDALGAVQVAILAAHEAPHASRVDLVDRLWTRWPVAKRNIRYKGERIDLSTLSEIAAAKEAGQRVIVRYSGTEPVLRILVEGLDAQKHLESISDAFNRSCS